MMSRQAPVSSSTATQNGVAPLFMGPDEDLVWLRRAWDVEKKEKAWLMARYEAIEARLKTKNEECSALRLLINPNQTVSQSEFRDGTPKLGLPAPELRDAASKPGLPGQPAGMDPVSPSGVDPVSPTSPPSSGILSLKERRGLKLGVTTSGLATNNTVGPAVCTNDRSGTSVVDQSVSSIDTLRAGSCDAVPTLGPREILEAPPMTGTVSTPSQRSTFNYNNLMEPASPLLKRRQAASPKGSDVRQPLVILEPESESPKQSMRVDAVKTSSLDMVPASPKRAKRRNDDFGEVSRVRSYSSMARVNEDVEAEQPSPTL